MRVWTLHPRYLDPQGLTACWREGLLAQAVLADRTRGYRSHSQLLRFRAQPDPLASIGAYLLVVADTAAGRGYSFDRTRIDRPATSDADADDVRRGGVVPKIGVTTGQVGFEWEHLRLKLADRSPAHLATLAGITEPAVHPLFVVVDGPVEPWERAG